MMFSRVLFFLSRLLPMNSLIDGQIVKLRHQGSGIVLPAALRVEVRPAKGASGRTSNPVVGFAFVGAPGEMNHLRIRPDRSIDQSGGHGAWALFEVVPLTAGAGLRCVGHQETPAYLSLTNGHQGPLPNGVLSVPDAWEVETQADASRDFIEVKRTVAGLPHATQVKLLHCDSGCTFSQTYVVEIASKEHIMKVCPEFAEDLVIGLRCKEGCLRILQSGRIDLKGGRGPWALFCAKEISLADGTMAVQLLSVAPRETALYLAACCPVGDAPTDALASSPTPVAWELKRVEVGAVQTPFSDGDRVRFSDGESAVVQQFQVQQAAGSDLGPNNRVFGFACVGNLKGHIRISPDSTCNLEGGRGAWALFEALPMPHAAVSLRCIGHRDSPAYLALQRAADGALEFACSKEPFPLFLECVRSIVPIFDDAVTLTNSQRDEFHRDGFLILRDVVPKALIDDAKRVVNHHLGTGPSAWVVDDENVKLPSSTHEAIINLVEQTPIWSAVQRMIGKDSLRRPTAGQLAIRFPVTDAADANPISTGSKQYHIDGMGKDQLIPFTLLAKVALSDQSEEGNGNFTVFPASHRKETVFQWYSDSLNDGSPAEKPDIGSPLQVRLAPGDVVIVHPHLAHCVGRNTSPNIRYSIIFRLHHVNRAEHNQRASVATLSRDPMGSIGILPSWE